MGNCKKVIVAGRFTTATKEEKAKLKVGEGAFGTQCSCLK